MWRIGESMGGRWEIFDIKSGGMGLVYLVFDRISEIPLAAKTYRGKIAGGDPAAKRFVDEAISWIKLDYHPNIVQALRIEELKGKPYVFMEYVDGGTLSSWIGTRRVAEDVQFTLKMALNICDGMIHATSKGLNIHGDLKPPNCLVTEGEMLKVTDFGIAKFWLDTAMNNRESSQIALGLSLPGTPAYMSPEQFDDPNSADARADIYGFGCTIFELISGHPPFSRSSWEGYEHAHKTATIPPLPPQYTFLASLLSSCLQKNRDDRIASFQDLREELGAIYRDLFSSSYPVPLIEELSHDLVEPLSTEDKNGLIRLKIETKPDRRYFMLPAQHFANKAVSLRRLGREEEALEACNLALRLDGDLLEAWLNKAAILLTLQRHEESMTCVDHVIEVAPGFTGAWGSKGSIFLQVKRYQEALECFERGIVADPNNATLWLGKGRSLEGAGQELEALECYRRASNLDPSLHNAWAAQADILQSRRVDKAEELDIEYAKALEMAIASNPGAPYPLINKGARAFMKGQLEGALKCFGQAIRICPEEPEGWYNLAQVLKALDRIDEALTSISQALRLNPELKDAWGTKGYLLLTQGRFRYAIACFDRALELNPNDTLSLNGRSFAVAEQEKIK